jgi:hypothetical protein
MLAAKLRQISPKNMGFESFGAPIEPAETLARRAHAALTPTTT